MEPARVLPDKAIRTRGQGDGSLGVFADGQTWNLHERRLFLDAARVRDDDRCVALKGEEVKVAQRIEEAHLAGARLQSKFGQALARPRVHGEENWQIPADLVEHAHERPQRIVSVHVRRTMQRDQGMAWRLLREAQAITQR